MAKQQLNARISDLTRRQLDELIERWGTTQTETLTLIIDRMYRQETQTMNRQELAQKFGTVTYKGTTYTLTSVADYSNNVFPGWWGDAEEGGEYTAEFSCPAVDDEGNEYWVYWQFDAVKGEEPEDAGNWPWGDEHITAVVPQ